MMPEENLKPFQRRDHDVVNRGVTTARTELREIDLSRASVQRNAPAQRTMIGNAIVINFTTSVMPAREPRQSFRKKFRPDSVFRATHGSHVSAVTVLTATGAAVSVHHPCQPAARLKPTGANAVPSFRSGTSPPPRSLRTAVGDGRRIVLPVAPLAFRSISANSEGRISRVGRVARHDVKVSLRSVEEACGRGRLTHEKPEQSRRRKIGRCSCRALLSADTCWLTSHPCQ